MTKNILTKNSYQKLMVDLAQLVKENKENTQILLRNQAILTYWQIGNRIESESLTQNANYFSSIIEDLAVDLAMDKSTLMRAVQFFKLYPEQPEPSTLTWSHYKSLMAVKDDGLRIELEKKSKKERWSIVQLSNNVKRVKDEVAKDAIEVSTEQKIIRPIKANYLYKAKIIDVVDGDTLILNVDLGFKVIKEQRIRLAQIDAPEMEDENGRKSFQYLRDLCARLEWVVVRTNKIDIYGRYLGDVFYLNTDMNNQTTKIAVFEEGVYLNEELVKKNLVKVV